MNNIINKQLKKGKIGHCYLIIGTKDQGLEIIKKIVSYLKIDPIDCNFLEPENTIKINQIRQLQRMIHLKPAKSDYKLAACFGAERLSIAAANALLKTLEEPPSSSILVLVTLMKDNILPTIISRSQVIKLPTKINQSEEKINSVGGKIMQISKMNIIEKFDYINQLCATENVEEILVDWLLFFRREVVINKKIEQLTVIRNLQSALVFLKNASINKKLLLENTIIQI